jgi:hypothetical protein
MGKSVMSSAIHPWIGVGDPSLIIHNDGICGSHHDRSWQTTLSGRCALALIAYDVIVSKETRRKIRQKFDAFSYNRFYSGKRCIICHPVYLRNNF